MGAPRTTNYNGFPLPSMQDAQHAPNPCNAGGAFTDISLQINILLPETATRLVNVKLVASCQCQDRLTRSTTATTTSQFPARPLLPL